MGPGRGVDVPPERCNGLPVRVGRCRGTETKEKARRTLSALKECIGAAGHEE